MSRSLTLALVATVIAASAGSALAGGQTIRIEPRGVYGATISLEAGVRVFRPLPPTTRMIINPNQTPVNLSISEETVNKTVRHYGSNGGSASGYGGGHSGGHDSGSFGGGGGFGSHGLNKRHGGRAKPRRIGGFPGRQGGKH